jgi:hypothetical protein
MSAILKLSKDDEGLARIQGESIEPLPSVLGKGGD